MHRRLVLHRVGRRGPREASHRRARRPADWFHHLPHELTHVLTDGRITTDRLPPWIDEGMALVADPAIKRAAHVRDLRMRCNPVSSIVCRIIACRSMGREQDSSLLWPESVGRRIPDRSWRTREVRRLRRAIARERAMTQLCRRRTPDSRRAGVRPACLARPCHGAARRPRLASRNRSTAPGRHDATRMPDTIGLACRDAGRRKASPG